MYFYFKKYMPNHYLQPFDLSGKVEDSDLAHFLEDGSKVKIHSEIRLPLLCRIS